MNEGGALIYKCRMCGEEFTPTHVPDLHFALMALVYNFVQIPESWGGIRPHVIELHWHKDGFGVADLVGGRKD